MCDKDTEDCVGGSHVAGLSWQNWNDQTCVHSMLPKLATFIYGVTFFEAVYIFNK